MLCFHFRNDSDRDAEVLRIKTTNEGLSELTNAPPRPFEVLLNYGHPDG